MKKTLTWIILVWSVLSIPYTLDVSTFYEFFFALLYVGLIIYLAVSDLKEIEKKEVEK